MALNTGISDRSLVEKTTHAVLIGDRPQARCFSITRARDEVGAARMEGAPRGPVVWVRDRARDRGQSLVRAGSNTGDGTKERPRVGMSGGVKYRVDRRLL